MCISAQNYPPRLFFAFLRGNDYWPRKLRNEVPKPAVTPSWNCALCNSSSQQPDWTMHCAVPVVIQPLDIPNCALRSFGIQSRSLPVKIGQSSQTVTTCMFHVIPPVCVGFQVKYCLSLVFLCLQVSQVFICLSVTQVQWLLGEKSQRHCSKHN